MDSSKNHGNGKKRSRPTNRRLDPADQTYNVFVEAADMEKLTGKLLVDTYSKRSQTLIEKVCSNKVFCGLISDVYIRRRKNWRN